LFVTGVWICVRNEKFVATLNKKRPFSVRENVVTVYPSRRLGGGSLVVRVCGAFQRAEWQKVRKDELLRPLTHLDDGKSVPTASLSLPLYKRNWSRYDIPKARRKNSFGNPDCIAARAIDLEIVAEPNNLVVDPIRASVWLSIARVARTAYDEGNPQTFGNSTCRPPSAMML
jgi:hypothetical protein